MAEELNRKNYHSREMAMKYMSYSQFCDFEKCEVMALAKVKGEYEQPKTESLLYGSWVDEHLNGPEDEKAFIEENKDKLYSIKTGQIYAAFKGVENTISFIENYTNEEGEKILFKYLSGERQVIWTGVIGGVLFKGMADSYFPTKCIVDGKVMKDFDKVWVERDGYRYKTDFIDAYGYTIEGAIFQELENQTIKKTNPNAKKIPFVLVPVTKEEPPNADLIVIDQNILDEALERVKEKAMHYHRIKMGLEEPKGCGKCPVCIAKKQILRPQMYSKLFLAEKEEE